MASKPKGRQAASAIAPGGQPLDQKVKQLLSDSFPNAKVQVASDHGKVDAYVVSGSFNGTPEPKRQEIAWNVLRGSLTPAEQQEVLFVLTLTPKEDDAIKAFPPNKD